MDAHLLGPGQEPAREGRLHEDLAARQRDPTLGRAEHPPVAAHAAEKLRGLHRFPVLHEEGVGIVAVLAPQGATVEEDRHPGAGAVHRGHELPGVDRAQLAIAHPSQAFRALKIRQLLEPADTRTAQAGGRGQEVLVPTAVAHGRRGLRHDRSPCSRAQAWEWKVRWRTSSCCSRVSLTKLTA